MYTFSQLLDKGAPATQSKEDGWTGLHVACKNGHLLCAQVLMGHAKGSARRLIDHPKADGWSRTSLNPHDGGQERSRSHRRAAHPLRCNTGLYDPYKVF